MQVSFVTYLTIDPEHNIAPPSCCRLSMDEELELIRSSLFPAEAVEASTTTPNQFTISSADSPYRIRFTVENDDAEPSSSLFQLTSDVMGKEEAVGWAQWVDERLADSWDEAVATG